MSNATVDVCELPNRTELRHVDARKHRSLGGGDVSHRGMNLYLTHVSVASILVV